MFLLDAITNLFSSIVGIVSKRIPDATAMNIDQTAENIATKAAQASATTQAGRIVLTEANGESWLQRNWRPTLMILLIAIIANNTFGVAYLHAREIVMTVQMWNLLTAGLGGYIGCRTVEKIVKVIKG